MRFGISGTLSLVSLLLALGCSTSSSGSAVSPAASGTPTAADPESSAGTGATQSEPSAPISDDPVVQAIIDEGHRDNRVHEHLRYLTEKIGPRLTGSHSLAKAEQWCVEQFARWGLDARRERWGSVPVGFDRGPWSGRMVSPSETPLEFTTPAWTPGAFGPVRGKVVAAPMTAAEVKRDRSRFVGAWVLQPKRGKDSRKPKVQDKIEELLHEAEIAGYIRSARSDKGLVHTSGRYRVGWDELPTDVQVVLRADQYDDLARRLGEGEEVEVEFSIDNRFFRGPVPQYNVIADLPGTDRPDEFVIVGGHLDSWDGADGANDNGTGVSTTLEAARLLVKAGARPKRTIRFMLWSGEEQGLLGSRGYVEQHEDLMANISAVLVHDGGTNFLSGLSVTPEMYPAVKQATDVLTRLDPQMPFEVKLADSLRPGGSDHSPFIGAGVPGFFWNQDGEADYSHVHHTQHDVLSEAREDYQRHSAMIVAVTALNLANLDDKLDRTNSSPIARRRMGVEFDALKVRSVKKKSKAEAAGWKVGDVVKEVDGQQMTKMWDVVKALQKGGPVKTVTIERKGKRIDTTLDYSADSAEKEREERRTARKAAGLPLPE